MTPKYNKLIAEVKEIDPKAADYLLYEAHKLNNFKPEYRLVHCFTFSDSLQSDAYWYNIMAKQNVLRRKKLHTIIVPKGDIKK